MKHSPPQSVHHHALQEDATREHQDLSFVLIAMNCSLKTLLSTFNVSVTSSFVPNNKESEYRLRLLFQDFVQRSSPLFFSIKASSQKWDIASTIYLQEIIHQADLRLRRKPLQQKSSKQNSAPWVADLQNILQVTPLMAYVLILPSTISATTVPTASNSEVNMTGVFVRPALIVTDVST